MRYNGTIKYCDHCGKETYHYPDGGCSSCYAEACGITRKELGQARRQKIAEKDKMMAQAIKEVNHG